MNWYTAGAMNATAAQPTFAQIRAERASAARYMNPNATCHAAVAMDMTKMATLVREKRVTTMKIANTITAAAVTAEGIANGENWYAGIFVWTVNHSGRRS